MQESAGKEFSVKIDWLVLFYLCLEKQMLTDYLLYRKWS